MSNVPCRWHKHWLSQGTVAFRKLCLSCGQGVRGAFAMYAETACLPLHHVRFDFADVVAAIVDDVEV